MIMIVFIALAVLTLCAGGMVCLSMYMLYQCGIVRLSVFNPNHPKIATAKAFVKKYGSIERVEHAGMTGIEFFVPLTFVFLVAFLYKWLFS